MSKVYKIGTRGSLLALTQCQQTRKLLEEKTGETFELVVIKTQGDEQTSKPLWQMDGKDFFTKELDQALLAKEIDLVVHSYKDLGSERPQGIALAAVTERFMGHDILLLRKDALEKITRTGEANIGTSSPRRIVNIEKSLNKFLPRKNAEKVLVKTSMLRGNVNTRLAKCAINKEYDGVVLAFAGLERLARDEKALAELKPLLDLVTFCVLPPSQFPWAASQGALGIECLEENTELRKKLSAMNHQDTIEEVLIERAAFQSFGGGCHLAVGIAAQKQAGVGIITSLRGHSDGKDIEIQKVHGLKEVTLNLKADEKYFIGVSSLKGQDKNHKSNKVYDELILKKPVDTKFTRRGAVAHFATHPQTLSAVKNHFQPGDLVFVAGSRTHEKAVELGLWVHASTDGLGEAELMRLEQSALLKNLGLNSLQKLVYTHKDGDSEWGEVLESYRREDQPLSPEFKRELAKCRAFYWSSVDQYQTYQKLNLLSSEARHFCGAGKSALKFRQLGLDVQPLSGMKEYLTLCDSNLL